MDSEKATQEGNKLDSEIMETKETDEGTIITIFISKAILDQIKHEAQAIGVSVYDMIRFTLGERFKTYSYGVVGSLPQPMPLFPSSPAPNFTKIFRELMAMSGQLKCDNCDSKLKLSDVRENTCSKCHWVMEPLTT